MAFHYVFQKKKKSSLVFPCCYSIIVETFPLTLSTQVIRALYDYEARSAQELSFSKGDFFHVIGREDDPDWYEACNPALPDARGLVPVAFFQALGKTERDSQQSDGGRPPTANKNPDHDSGYGEVHSPPGTAGAPGSQRASKAKQGAMVYGVVMYDFNAERSDELEAKAGEAIIVIAQSNPEWFVAKPIGRLGGPGLIPVSFIELRDMGTGKAIENPDAAIRQAGVPKVEEWKKMATAYKNSSITLGKFEGGGPSQPLEQSMERMSIQPGPQVSFLCFLSLRTSRFFFFSFNSASSSIHSPLLSSPLIVLIYLFYLFA